MLHMIATMISLMMAAGAGGVIAVSLAEDWSALRRALAATAAPARITPLPPRVRRLTGARGARIIRLAAAPAAWHAAA